MSKQEALEDLVSTIGRAIGPTLPVGVGFTLMLFDYGSPGSGARYLAYISSAQRADIIKVMREAIARFEGGMGARDYES